MIYESAVVLSSNASDEVLSSFKKDFKDTLTSNDCSVIIEEDWGNRTFAQPTSKGQTRGHYLYFMYKGQGSINLELERKMNINESILNYMFVKLGNDKKEKQLVNNHKNPFQNN